MRYRTCERKKKNVFPQAFLRRQCKSAPSLFLSKIHLVLIFKWKCNGSVKSSSELVAALNSAKVPADAEVVVAPPSLHVGFVKNSIKSPIDVAVQNCSASGNGAFTGELSADMVKDFGLKWVILGHSERRQLYKENDAVSCILIFDSHRLLICCQLIAKKVKYALSKGLSVIACIGETLDERKAGQTMDVCIRQLKAIGGRKLCFFCFAVSVLNIYRSDVVQDWSRIVVAYEPVWAIGTGVNASKEQVFCIHCEAVIWPIVRFRLKRFTRLCVLGWLRLMALEWPNPRASFTAVFCVSFSLLLVVYVLFRLCEGLECSGAFEPA